MPTYRFTTEIYFETDAESEDEAFDDFFGVNYKTPITDLWWDAEEVKPDPTSDITTGLGLGQITSDKLPKGED